MGDGFSLSELRDRTDLEHLVTLDQEAKGKRAVLTVWDDVADVMGEFWVDRDFSATILTGSLTYEEALEVKDQVAPLKLPSVHINKIGLRYFVEVKLDDPNQRDFLPKAFITTGRSVRTPRTHPYKGLNEHFWAAYDGLVAHGYHETPRLTRRESAFNKVRSLRGEVRLQVSAMADPELDAFAEMVRSDPVLRDEFQTYVYTSRPLSAKDAKAAFKEAVASLNGDRWFQNDIRVVPTSVRNGMFMTKRYFLRAYSALYPGVESPNILESFSMKLPSGEMLEGLKARSKPGCWSSYRDMAHQDEQRLFLELAFPAMHTPTRRQLTAERLKNVVQAMPRHTAAVDYEVTDFCWDKHGPSPSGMVFHGIVRTDTDSALFVHQDYKSPAEGKNGYRFVSCVDELVVLRETIRSRRSRTFVVGSNFRGYDRKHEEKFFSSMSEKARQEWAARTIASAPKDKQSDSAYIALVEEHTKKTRDSITALRKLHRPKDYEGPSAKIIDLALTLFKLPRMLTGFGLEAIMAFHKGTGYDRIEENNRTKTPEGLAENEEYSTHDGDETWDGGLRLYPVVVARSAGSGKGLHRATNVKNPTLARNMQKKNALWRGKHLDSDVRVRDDVDKREEELGKALGVFRRLEVRSAKSGRYTTNLYYNPSIVRAFSKELSRIPELSMLGSLGADNIIARVAAMDMAEHYIAPYLRALRQVYKAAEIKPLTRISPGEFDEAVSKAFKKGAPDLRLTRELQFPIDLTLWDVHSHLRRVQRELSPHAAGITAAVGPYLLGNLPEKPYGRYLIGHGPMVVFDNRLLGLFSDSVGSLLFAHRVFINKTDAELRPQLVDYLSHGTTIAYAPKNPRVQKTFEYFDAVPRAPDTSHLSLFG